MTNEAENRSVFDKGSLVTVGSAASVGVAIVGLHLWLTNQFAEIKSLIDGVDRRVERVEMGSVDRWTASDMKIWELECRRMNPANSYPDVFSIIQQKKANADRFPTGK